MKTPRLYLGAITLTCVIALVIGMAGAAGMAWPVAGIAGNMTGHAGPEKMLDRLEGQGIDVSAVRTAFTSGDTTTARTLMLELVEAHKDLFPARNVSGMGGSGYGAGMMANHLDRMEEQGFDVAAIRAAVQSGDTATAHTLMQQFMEAHKDELPAPLKNSNRQERMTGLLDLLETKGYDVSSIRAAFDSGDKETARTLMHQFMETHKDELSLPGKGQGCPLSRGAGTA